ncbi:phosphoribosylanthranilate isomerase [Iamia sp. SCSIO 61187]|uniref:phosphoribosylanthranilate isomerase n=1 Tax=Iamia sp. SCSIO 61187 TaxID=2722752 RepID=UPI001C62AB85|nr:phosphoribosylanthranilate isomerase [Iamia sp. SCSIO 61187]QYG93345.1 phosphoribosylanthranilate isomerase [Iamia sp. SCSIO 61187]
MFVKICGVTSEEDALLAVAMDADAVGFNFVSGSPRQIAPQAARDIARRLPAEALTVGIFRDEAPERVVSIVNEAGLRGAQLHGRESIEATRYVAARVPFVIKVFRADDPALARADEYGAQIVMLDGARPGSGETWDWDLAAAVPDGLKLLLAGGLTPDNVADAVEAVRPWGVDVASGVERSSGAAGGKKDPRKVRLFVANARAAAPAAEPGPDAIPYDWIDDT